LEMKERKLRMQIMHSKLMKRVLETKLAAAENRLGDDLALKPGQSFGFSMAQRKALAVHGVSLDAILTAQHTVTSSSAAYAFTEQQQAQLKLRGLDKASIAKAEAALNAHIAASAKSDVPGWNGGEEVTLLQEEEEDGMGARSAVAKALSMKAASQTKTRKTAALPQLGGGAPPPPPPGSPPLAVKRASVKKASLVPNLSAKEEVMPHGSLHYIGGPLTMAAAGGNAGGISLQGVTGQVRARTVSEEGGHPRTESPHRGARGPDPFRDIGSASRGGV
jgi:hypothetical protein